MLMNINNHQQNNQELVDQPRLREQTRIMAITRTKTKSVLVRTIITCGLFLLPISRSTKLCGCLGGVILIYGEKMFTKAGGSKLKKLRNKVSKTVIHTFMNCVLIGQIIIPLTVSSSVNNEMPRIEYSSNRMRMANIPNRSPAFWKKWSHKERVDRCCKMSIGTVVAVNSLAELSYIGLDFKNPEIYPVMVQLGSGVGLVIDACKENKHSTVLYSLAAGGVVCQTVIDFSRGWKEAEAFVDANQALVKHELLTETLIKTTVQETVPAKTGFQETVPVKTGFQETARKVTLVPPPLNKHQEKFITEFEDKLRQMLNLNDLVDDLDDGIN